MPTKIATHKQTRRIAPATVKKSVSQITRDIADWKRALLQAQRAQDPKFVLLQDLFDDISNDALLTSQINNRHERTIATPFELSSPDGTVNDDLTAQLRNIPFMLDMFKQILDSEMFGYSLIEISTDHGTPTMDAIYRQNIDPVNGRFYPDTSLNGYVAYRETAEFNRWILEFNSGNIGILNKSVPHILFKKFAQSCWSELCEIYGIPPRFIKTDTTNPEMLDRAEMMMRDMGAAAAFVIDTEEEFQFANGANTNGDIYNNLIRLCNNETSMLISGAIIGQDTENGNYSKEQSSISILDRLVESDKRTVESYMNSIVLPAFEHIGLIPAVKDCKFRFSSVDNPDKMWQLVKDILPYKDVDSKWLTETFGIPVSDKQPSLDPTLSERSDRFFR